MDYTAAQIAQQLSVSTSAVYSYMNKFPSLWPEACRVDTTRPIPVRHYPANEIDLLIDQINRERSNGHEREHILNTLRRIAGIEKPPRTYKKRSSTAVAIALSNMLELLTRIEHRLEGIDLQIGAIEFAMKNTTTRKP